MRPIAPRSRERDAELVVEQDPSRQSETCSPLRSVPARPTSQHIGHPPKHTSAPAAGNSVHHPRAGVYKRTRARNPNPSKPLMM